LKYGYNINLVISCCPTAALLLLAQLTSASLSILQKSNTGHVEAFRGCFHYLYVMDQSASSARLNTQKSKLPKYIL